MGDSGWWPIIAFAVFLDPRIALAGIATGLLVQRWPYVLLGLFVAPAAYWLYCTIFLRTDHFLELAPLMAVAGVAWTALSFGIKRAWRA